MDINKVFVIVALFLNGSYGEERYASEDLQRLNSSQTIALDAVEVPDSSLLLLDRLNYKRLPTMAYYARNRQTIETNSTSTSSSEEEDHNIPHCTCSLGVCKCCTGLLLYLLKQTACMRITYHPGDFAFDVAMLWNDNVIYENSVSGKNPKPICISPPRLNNLKVCAKFYNVFFPGRNFHFCLAMSGQWRSYELFYRAFDCLRMGANGITMMSPEDSGGLVIPNPQGGVDAVIDSGDDIEDYDENVVKSLLNLFDR